MDVNHQFYAIIPFFLTTHYLQMSEQIIDSESNSFFTANINDQSGTSVKILRLLFDVVRHFSGAESVGFRINYGERFPFYTSKSLESGFILINTNLCSDPQTGNAHYCICEKVLKGNTKIADICFTAGGSFWTNNSSQYYNNSLLHAHWNNERCKGIGYESVALLPMRKDDKIIGLIQLNDKRANVFSIDKIEYLEKVANQIGKIFSSEIRNTLITPFDLSFRQIIDLVPQMIFAKDKKGCYLLANKALADAYGTTVDQIIGKNHLDIHPSNTEAAKFIADDREVIESGITKYIPEERFTDYEGNVRLLQLTKCPFKITGYDEITALGIAVDVTELGITTEALIDSEQQLCKAQRIGQMGSWHWDLVTNTVHWSDALFDILGAKKEDLGTSYEKYKSFIHVLDLADVMKALNAAIQRNVPYKLDYRLLRSNGEVCYVHERAEVSFVNGKPVSMLGTIIDITERKRKEEELRQAKQKAEGADAIKSFLLDKLSYQVRAPLNSVMGFSDLLATGNPDDAKKVNYVTQIRRSSRALLNMIDDIIDFAKIESKQITTLESICHLNSLLQETYLKFDDENILFNRQNIELRLKVAINDNGFAIITDTFRLRQILNNLVSNALKFTKRGYVEFGYSLIPSSEADEYVSIQFYVKDTGDGFSDEKQKEIFRHFKILQTEHFQGDYNIGLGLAIAYQLAIIMGGSLWLESKHKQGTTFYFTIPYNPVHIPLPIPESTEIQANYNWNNKHILIAEDEESNYFLLVEIITPTGATLHWVKDGHAAIEYCKTNRHIDTILMDLNMPVIDGYEATRAIKQQFVEKKIPIIAQTAYAMSGEKERALNAGCDNYIAKPINARDLLTIINKYLS